jgi:hypothetical protein
MERIRKALAETPAIVLTPPLPREGPVFRVTIYGPKPDRPIWIGRPSRHASLRGRFITQFLEQVTRKLGPTLRRIPALPLVDSWEQIRILRKRAEARVGGPGTGRKGVPRSADGIDRVQTAELGRRALLIAGHLRLGRRAPAPWWSYAEHHFQALLWSLGAVPRAATALCVCA